MESGKSIADASQSLGVAEQTLAYWLKAKGAGKFKEVSGKGRVTTEQMEIDKNRFRHSHRHDCYAMN